MLVDASYSYHHPITYLPVNTCYASSLKCNTGDSIEILDRSKKIVICMHCSLQTLSAALLYLFGFIAMLWQLIQFIFSDFIAFELALILAIRING